MAVALVAAIAFSYFFVKQEIFRNDDFDPSDFEKNGGLVYGEGDQERPGRYNSENFSLPQLETGSVMLNYTSDEDQWNLDISDVRNEIYAAKNKNYKLLLLRWKTGKPTKCEIKYSRAGSPDEKIYAEDNFEMEHSILLENLDSATTYNYIISAKDKWGNAKDSDKFAVYTGAPELSFIDLLGSAFKDVFGWAMNK